MGDRIEIPESNLKNITKFFDEPDRDLIREIKSHVKETAAPHTWWGHSHTEPPEGAVIEYLDEFDVPAPKHTKAVAPCPCCSPYHPKYKNKGKIAWFPNEGTIRLIGPECFKKRDENAHVEANIRYLARKKRNQEIDSIASYSKNINSDLDLLEELLPIAEAIDEFRNEFREISENTLNIEFWRHTRDGTLYLQKQNKVQFQRRDGSTGSITEERREIFCSISGFEILSRSATILEEQTIHIITALKRVRDGLGQVPCIQDLSDANRQKFAETLSKAQTMKNALNSEVRKQQSFLLTNGLDKLIEWGKHQNCPISFNIERRGREITFGSAKETFKFKAAALRKRYLSSDQPNQFFVGIHQHWSPD